MKKTKQSKISLKLLGKILTIVLIVLLALISFGGIYVVEKNSMKNILPEYELGMDIYGARNVVIKVDNSTELKKYDTEGNLVTDTSEIAEENITEVEEPVNAQELLTSENYKKVKDIIEKRLEYMEVSNYLLRFDETNGQIALEIPEDTNTDNIAQYTITKGEFKIVDNDTEEVLLTNSHIKNATVQYGTSTTGTTVYLSIQFNKEGTEKLKEISNTYISTTDEEGNETTKQIKMTLDDETIMVTYFDEEIVDGLIQLSIGESTDSETLQNYLQQASNIAILLNTEAMPLTYTMEINRFVYSDLIDSIKTLIIVFIVIALLMAIYMIIKFNKNGLMGVLLNIGFVALLLLGLRYGNVVLTLSGIFAIAAATIIEYIITILILKEYSKNVDNESARANIKEVFKKLVLILIPLLVMTITFAFTNWEEISSVGLILFWGILIMAIYNYIILSIEIFNTKKITENKSK